MRYFLLLVSLGLLAPATRAVAQTPDTAGLVISRLPATGLLLDKGWRYHSGDDPAWARPTFDERAAGWDTLNPTRPLPPTAAPSRHGH